MDVLEDEQSGRDCNNTDNAIIREKKRENLKAPISGMADIGWNSRSLRTLQIL